MALKPWHTVVTPREDLRANKPLDASEFAVHLDQVRDGRGPDVYKNPEQFMSRTYITPNLAGLAGEVVRRLSGEKTETSAVFNLATQFGGGKTHALTLLYHLAKNGNKMDRLPGVQTILDKAGVKSVPQAAVAVFVGTEFDSLRGRGGDDGTPLRKTPWGEIAFQLGGAAAFKLVADHEKEFIEPKGDVIRSILPKDRPCLILMDEIINYASTYRRKGYGNALYNFMQALSETVRGQDNVVLVVSIPASELEYTSDDEADEQRFKKVLDRLGKAIVMSAETETSEIIRRRLFEWDEAAISSNGKVMLPKDAMQTCNDYAAWVTEHRQQIPDFPVDNAREAFAAAYPFHPALLSVFERKWQALPRFQRTRGVLRLLALWVSRAYTDGFKGAQRDPLIGLGTAPLDDPLFRAALFEQLGENKLEAAVTTDITGKKDSHATRLDQTAAEAIAKSRLHRKAATAIFFESNGGQMHGEATIPEIRLAVSDPSLDIGNIETVLETLSASCYYLSVERNRYRFSLSPNLNKLLADRRAGIQSQLIEERVRAEVQKVFAAGTGAERVYFPERSGSITDRPLLTFVILPPDPSQDEKKALQTIESMTRECGSSGRTFKSALIWCLPDPASNLYDESRKLLAWETIDQEQSELRLDDSQKRQLGENLDKAKRDLKEGVWRAYKTLVMLGKDNTLRAVDLGLVHSSAANNIVTFILNRLRQDGDVEEAISPNFLLRNWPPAFKEWSTKAVRDAFFAAPQFPRLLNPDVIKQTISRGVESGLLGYVGKAANGDYHPFVYGVLNIKLPVGDVEISDDVFIITNEVAEGYKKSKESPQPTTPPRVSETATPLASATPSAQSLPFAQTQTPTSSSGLITRLRWTGEVPWQKWTNFYQKVLSKFTTGRGIKLTVSVEVSNETGISAQKIEETKSALRELGLGDEVKGE